jgi:hypothetical protein
MKTLQEQYNLINEGRGNKEILLKTAKQLYPNVIPNHFTYNQAIPLLKQRGLLHESIGGVVTKGKDPDWFAIFKENINEAKAIEKKPTKEVVDMETKGFDYKNKENIDNIYGQAFLVGYYTEMKDPKNVDKTVDDLKAIVAKNLYKDPLYYVKNGQFGVKGVGYTDDIPGLKPSKTDQMVPVPDQIKPRASKTDLGDREKKTGAAKGIKGEMTITPKSSRGVKKMPLPGKEKKVRLQENNIRSLISQLIKEELEKTNVNSEEKWNLLTPDEQEELLMTFIKEPDEALKYVGTEFHMLPDVVISNMDSYFLHEEEKGAVELPKTTSPSDVKKYTEQDIDVKLTEDEDLDYNPEMFDDVYYQQIEDLEQQLATTTDSERAEELQRKIDYLMKNIM